MIPTSRVDIYVHRFLFQSITGSCFSINHGFLFQSMTGPVDMNVHPTGIREHVHRTCLVNPLNGGHECPPYGELGIF